MISTFFTLHLPFIVLAPLIFFFTIIKPRPFFSLLGFKITIIGFFFHSIIVIFRYFTSACFPVTDLHQSLFFFAWCFVGVFIIFNIKHKIPVLGSFCDTIGNSFSYLFSFPLYKPVQIPPPLRSIWLPIHTTLAFLGEAFFGSPFAVDSCI